MAKKIAKKKTSSKPDIIEGLSDKQMTFCHEYLKDFNATQAAIRSGYSQKTARQIASENLSKPDIQDQIQQLADLVSTRTGNDIEKIITELQIIAFGSLKDVAEWTSYSLDIKNSSDITDNQAKLISEISEHRGDKVTSIKIKMHDKLKALELLGKYHKIFTDKLEIIDLSTLSDEELLRRTKMLASSLEPPKN